jgi:hypothetical protein
MLSFLSHVTVECKCNHALSFVSLTKIGRLLISLSGGSSRDRLLIDLRTYSATAFNEAVDKVNGM